MIVSKAATIALHHHLTSLLPNLAAAFPRFLEDSTKSDPQCWAKNALAKTLAAFEYQEHEFFLTGMRHIQLEGSWGGSSDTAGTLRGTCALALAQCRGLNSHPVLLLVPPLADKELPVRVNVVRAIEQVGTDSAALLLRLLAELASDGPEVLGASYTGVLAIEGSSALDWVARFLPREDDPAAETVMAIAQTHVLEAFRLLQTTFRVARDPWFRSTVLTAIALTRHQEATDWLIDLIANDDVEAADAHKALCRSGPSVATRIDSNNYADRAAKNAEENGSGLLPLITKSDDIVVFGLCSMLDLTELRRFPRAVFNHLWQWPPVRSQC